ncbi:hypothetical protein LZ30DRAFT_717316 [Colletotrichum cereale]|nr:hypothetical protein LZ30DRAFT_717316 [Colletotrichum cereale]
MPREGLSMILFFFFFFFFFPLSPVPGAAGAICCNFLYFCIMYSFRVRAPPPVRPCCNGAGDHDKSPFGAPCLRHLSRVAHLRRPPPGPSCSAGTTYMTEIRFPRRGPPS